MLTMILREAWVCIKYIYMRIYMYVAALLLGNAIYLSPFGGLVTKQHLVLHQSPCSA